MGGGRGAGGAGGMEGGGEGVYCQSISLNVLFTAQTLPGFIFNSAIHMSDGKQEPSFTLRRCSERVDQEY